MKTKKGTEVFGRDEHPRETTMEKLGKLPPVFKEDGLVSAGNASVSCNKHFSNVNIQPLLELLSSFRILVTIILLMYSLVTSTYTFHTYPYGGNLGSVLVYFSVSGHVQYVKLGGSEFCWTQTADTGV